MNLSSSANLAASIREFNEILEQFEKQYGIVACVAGGAPRDALLGRERKDIDVFILQADKGKLPNDLLRVDADGYEGAEVDFVLDLLGGNVIVLGPSITNFHQAIARNDFGICQVGYTKAVGFIFTPAFHHDAENQTFTLLRGGDDAQRSLERFDRLQAKYDGWQLVVPEATTASIFD